MRAYYYGIININNTEGINMSSVKKLSGVALASAAATLILAGCGGEKAAEPAKEAAAEKKPAAPATKVADVKCSGTNSCKGTSECATATSGCKGQNSCKGQGWVKASKEDCDAKGGKAI